MVLIGILVELALLAILVYAPFMHKLFNTAPLRLSDWAFLLIWPVVIIALEEIRKAIVRSRDKRKSVKTQKSK